jgi:hypothetical protein
MSRLYIWSQGQPDGFAPVSQAHCLSRNMYMCRIEDLGKDTLRHDFRYAEQYYRWPTLPELRKVCRPIRQRVERFRRVRPRDARRHVASAAAHRPTMLLLYVPHPGSSAKLVKRANAGVVRLRSTPTPRGLSPPFTKNAEEPPSSDGVCGKEEAIAAYRRWGDAGDRVASPAHARPSGPGAGTRTTRWLPRYRT